MKKNEIWSFKNLDEYFDPKFGLVYKDFGNNAFEIILVKRIIINIRWIEKIYFINNFIY